MVSEQENLAIIDRPSTAFNIIVRCSLAVLDMADTLHYGGIWRGNGEILKLGTGTLKMRLVRKQRINCKVGSWFRNIEIASKAKD